MKMNVNKNVGFVAEVAIIASVYVVLTVALSFISYGVVQFRIAEALLVLVLFRKSAPVGLILGCALANLFSPLGVADIIIGTGATALGVFGGYLLRERKIVFFFLPTVLFNTIIIGLELLVFVGTPLILGASAVFIGEVVVLYGLGIPFYYGLKKIGFKSDFQKSEGA